MLKVKSLRKGFGSGNNRLEVLKGIDMELQTGELVALMGPSGCGKSTLLNIIGGLLAAEDGSILLKDKSYGLKNPSSVVNIRRELVGWIFQDFHLLPHLSALDNVAIALDLDNISAKDADKAARIALEKVGLGDRMGHIPGQLSGGQQQRVAIARAIAGNRPLLLADEPTGNLDIASGKAVMQLFAELCGDKENPISILMVTHDPELATKADRMLLLRDGKTFASDIREAWGEDINTSQDKNNQSVQDSEEQEQQKEVHVLLSDATNNSDSGQTKRSVFPPDDEVEFATCDDTPLSDEELQFIEASKTDKSTGKNSKKGKQLASSKKMTSPEDEKPVKTPHGGESNEF